MEAKSIGRNSMGMFDLSRGFLMFAVVLAHSVTMFIKYWEPQYTTQWWYGILIVFKPAIYGLIPMFFMMSGYGFRKKKLKNCIKERAKYILKPYAITGIVIVILTVCKALVANNSVREELWHYAAPFVLGLCPGEMWLGGHYTGSIGPIWFLLVLMLSWIFLDIIFYLENDVIRAVCVITLAAFCTRLPFLSFIPYCLIQSLACTSYLYLGYVIRKNNLLHQKLSKQNLLILILISFVIMIFGNIEVSQNVWALGMLDFIASAIIGFLLLKAFNAVNERNLTGKIASALRTAGKYSLYILCVHTIEYLVFPWSRITDFFANHKLIGIIAAMCIRTVIITVGCWFITQYIRRKRKRK